MARTATVDDYVAGLKPEARRRIQRIRLLVRRHVPGATETVSYRIVAFRVRKIFMYAGAFKDHIGVFPPVKGDSRLVELLAPYRNAKGNLRFAFAEPMPHGLITQIIRALARQSGA